MVRKRGKRGSSMGRSTQKSRTGRKTGKRYLTIPDKWSMYKEEADSTVKMDILPYIVNDVSLHPEGKNMEDDVWYRFPYLVHRNVGPSKNTVICPGTIGRPCPICDKRQEIFDDPDLDNKMAGKFKPSPRSLFIIKVINDGNNKNKGKRFIWDISDFCFFDQMDTELEHGEEEWNDFACLEGGYTLKVRLLEDSFDTTKFPKTDRIDFIERTKDYPESILDELPCLDDMIIPNIKSYEEIEAIMEGMDEADDEDEDKPKTSSKSRENTKTTKSTASRKKTPQDDEEEDPDEEEDEDPDGDEEETPKKSTRAKKTASSKKTSRAKKVTWEQLEDLDEDGLLDIVQEKDLEIDDDEWDDEDELREAIASILDIEIPEPDDDKEEDPDEEDEEDEEEEEEEEEEKTPKKGRKGKAPSKPTPKKQTTKPKPKSKPAGKSKGQCPHGYKFGEEFGDYEECNEDDCPRHDDCFDKYDELNGEE